jgi:dihydroorotate dehydrogenase (NAD+) catalytic subunit
MELKNPVIAASGSFGSEGEYQELVDIAALGAIATKGTTLHPRSGNDGQRLVDTASGIINCIGLENPGVTYLVEKQLPLLRKFNVPIIANIAGNTIAETVEAAVIAAASRDVWAIELNISCPNVKKGGAAFGAYPETAGEITRCVSAGITKPLIVKLAPMVTNICAIADAVIEAGADALSLINTVPAMAIDITTRRPVLGNISGGLSGPAIKPIALKAVWDVSRSCRIPLIGGGGIATWRDALEFIFAGASAIQVGTATFGYPPAMEKIIAGLQRWMRDSKIDRLEEVVGIAQRC